MNDPDLVRSGESRTDLDHNREYARDGQCMRIPFLDSEHLRQRRTVDQLHRQELFAQVFSDVVHPRDVFVGDAAGQADFAAEAIEHTGNADDFATEHFERNDLSQLDVAGSVDGAGAAAANQPEELIATAKQGRLHL